jgi:hypothetical protein
MFLQIVWQNPPLSYIPIPYTIFTVAYKVDFSMTSRTSYKQYACSRNNNKNNYDDEDRDYS